MKVSLETMKYKKFNGELAEKVMKKVKNYETTARLDKVVDFEVKEGKELNTLTIFERDKTKEEVQKERARQEREALNVLATLAGRRLV